MGILGCFYSWVSDGCVGDGDSEGATTQSGKGEWAKGKNEVGREEGQRMR